MARLKTTEGQRAQTTTKRRLPAALQANAAALVSGAQARRAAAARAALQRARDAHREAARGTFELGIALGELKKPGMSEAAGFADGFYAMCAGQFELARTTVDRLLRAVSLVSEARYAELKAARVDALLDLAMATEADDTAQVVAEKTVALWKGGPKATLKAMPTAAVRAATKQVRAHLAERAGDGATPTKKPRGRTTTPTERAAAEKGTKTLRKRGSDATVKVRATKPGAAAVFDVVGLTEAELAALLAR
jgi:hypothetical protein